MARCIRDGARYKRHRFKAGKCEACGAAQLVKETLKPGDRFSLDVVNLVNPLKA